jgi:tRNA (cytidine/uridine-2'-O-)-methyltransferase
MTFRIGLYQPDIPQNTGTILRLAACLGLGVDVVGPTGFDMTDRALRRAGLVFVFVFVPCTGCP